MSTILLSIRPEFANRILDGTKKFEFRKRLASDNVRKIIIYSTAPEKKIVGEVEVIGTLSMKKAPLWEKTKKAAGISREKYREYFCGCTIAHAYVLGKVTKYEAALSLADIGLMQAPQSFVYISDR